MLDYFPNADHAGIYAAKAQRRLQPRRPRRADPDAERSRRAAQAAGRRARSTSPISYEPELLLARDKGLKLVAVGALVQKPLTSIMSIGKHAIADPKDLKGKTVGTAGIPYQSAYLKAILDRAGVDPSSVKEVNVGFNLVPAMLSKKVDATLGAFWNYEGVQLRLREAAPADHPHGERRRPDLRRARHRRPPARTWPRAASACGASCARSARATTALRADPDGRGRAAAEGQPRPRPPPAARERQGDAARLLPGRRASRSAGWTPPSGRATATGCTPTSCSAARPTRRAR